MDGTAIYFQCTLRFIKNCRVGNGRVLEHYVEVSLRSRDIQICVQILKKGEV